MLSAEEHPGIFTFLVGMIVLVMAAVGLSIVADKHLKLSRGAGEISREINADATEISEMSSQHDEKSLLLAEYGSKLQTGTKTHKEFASQLESLRQRKASLEVTVLQTRAAIATLEAQFARYREEYRRKTWAGAVGENLGTLTVRGGRDYLQATITRVTDVGLEIRHENGIARIQAPDLDPKFRDRFQWSDEERRTRLKQELEQREGKPAEPVAENSDTGEPATAVIADPPPVPKVNRPSTVNSAENVEKLRIARQQVMGWKMKVATLSSEAMEASSRASYGNQSSVPGSLETWSAKSSRVSRELGRARAALSVAKSKLAEISPRDSLLKEPAADY